MDSSCARGGLDQIIGEHFTERAAKRWHKLPREVLDSPPLEMSQIKMNVALEDVVWGEHSAG